MSRIALAFTLVLLAFMAQGCSTARELITPYPTDSELEAHFYIHKDDFEELVRLFEEDSNVWQIDSDMKAWISKDNLAELSKARVDRYRILLSRTKVRTIARDYPQPGKRQRPAIFMNVWNISTFMLEGKLKSYVYKFTDDTKLLNSLDELHDSGRVAEGYKKINEDWRLFLDVY